MPNNYRLFITLLCCCSLLSGLSQPQNSLAPLTIDKIMRDPTWIGTSPSNIQWNKESNKIYFLWNPENQISDSIYSYSLEQKKISKLSSKEKVQLLTNDNFIFNQSHTSWIYSKNGDIFYQSNAMSYPIAIVRTLESESNPQFSFDETAIVYQKGDNLFAWNMADGSTVQLTQIIKGAKPKITTTDTKQEVWLKADQLKEFDILRERKNKKELSDSTQAKNKIWNETHTLEPIYIDDKLVSGLQISPDGRYISFRLVTPNRGKNTIVPNYVTESGFTESIPARQKVGVPDGKQEFFIYNLKDQTHQSIDIKSLPGIYTIPEYFKDYPAVYKKMEKDSAAKSVAFTSVFYSPLYTQAAIDIRSLDNKDRWICQVDLELGKLTVLDHQHDEAWIGGPGIGSRFGGGVQGWLDENRYYFQSEKSGYSHLYLYDLNSNQTIALTQGNYEVQRAILTNDKTSFFIVTNQVHPGEQQAYTLNIETKEQKKITTMTGAHTIFISPDEKHIAYLYSYTNKPWELFLQENKTGATPVQITDNAMSPEFKSYAWRDPEVISFTARDGAKVYSRLYKPLKKVNNKAAVIFVHGAGYLQNAHKWWSSYFREYFFHNLLVDLGYTVIDIDYRASAGYGRDWRTGIYRFMGGKDLTDHIDAVDFLVKQHGVHPKKIGIYGGSYGGFITLMGLFTSPETFAAGAALRPVTDWAQYNHPYTANILNEPATDSIAYRKSSPFYHAAGLTKPLLICHGMVDVNVHYQDAVKLAQRLIELKKENWELASYPMEDHGFVEPSSWTDEYKRILKLFNQWLK